MSNTESKKAPNDEDVRELVVARLKMLSPDTMISVGADGSFSRDELIQHVEEGDRVGDKIAEMQLQWLRSFKEVLSE